MTPTASTMHLPTRPALVDVVLLAALCAPGLAAQSGPGARPQGDYTVRSWTVRDGLPSNTTNDVLFSSDGYIWLATIEGVVRFDGQHFAVFNATNTPQLPFSRVMQLAEGPAGHIWIRTAPSGLTHFHNGRFSRVEIAGDSSAVVRVVHASGEATWVQTREGLARFRDGSMQPLRHGSIPATAERAVQDRTGRVWIGTTQGSIYRVDPDGSVREFSRDDSVPPSPVLSMLVDRAGVVWAASQRGLVRILDDELEVVPHPGGPWPDGTQAQMVDADGSVWIAAGGEGWWRFEPSGRATRVAVESPGARTGEIAQAPDKTIWRAEQHTAAGATVTATVYAGDDPVVTVPAAVRHMAFDAEGGAWIATGAGLLQLAARPLHVIGTEAGLTNPNIYPVLEDRSGSMWVGTFGGGVVRLGPNPLRVATDADGGSVLSLHEDTDGTIWVGQFGPTCRISGGRCVEINLAGAGDAGRGVRAMHEDRKGRLWLGGHNGLAVGEGPAGERRWSGVESEDGFPSSPVRVILELRDGELLFGTQGEGVLRLVEPGRFEVLGTGQGLPSGLVRDLYEDRAGYIWIALEDRGLCRLDRGEEPALAEGRLDCLDTRAGLYHDGLHRLLEDDQGRFWFNTNNGIFQVERAALNAYLDGRLPAITPISYTEADGMRDREGNGGMQPAGTRTSSGELWFPTRNGVVVIDPAAIPAPYPPRVSVEEVRIAGAPHPATDTVALGTARDVTFRYTALEFAHPGAVRYQYRLAGYDDWQYAGDQRTATYTNLAPGAYQFEVRALLGQQWSQPAALVVRRAGFFWEKAWFQAMTGLLLLGIGVAAYRTRLRQHAARSAHLERLVDERTIELRAKTRELEEANSLKSRFLANISHEFRTPLTLTFGPIDDLLSGRFKVEDDALPHLERARSNGSRLLRLINQLLDLSRIDARALTLHPELRDLGSHLRQLCEMFAVLASERGVELVTRLPAAPRQHGYDPEMLERVVINLLSNAFKFTSTGDSVTVSLTYSADGAACIEVADTGPGIEEEHLPRLFDRFYQVEGAATRMHEGTGIGLALARELVELHGGEMGVASAAGAGTTFTVRLPHREAGLEGSKAAAGPVQRHEEVAELVNGSRMPVADAAPAAAASDGPGERPLVLVVEDNSDMRAYIRGHLEPEFELIEAADGLEGFDRASEVVPDLVLSDVMMPKRDGLELCAELKADERTSHIPVVLLTARAEVEDRIGGYESGADGYLAKPFNAQELRVRVRTLVEDRRRLRARFAAAGPGQAGHRERIDPADVNIPAPVLPAREAAFLAKVRGAIEAGMGEPSYGVDRLAEEVFMSPRQLYRKLGALTGETPAGLIRRLRMQQAKELLAAGEMSVKQVAHHVGFRSRPSFSAAFREEFGVPPSDAHGGDSA